MTDDGATATGGMRGITDDTPEHAGAPGEAGSVDGVSAFGGEPESGEVGAFSTPAHDAPQDTEAITASMDDEREREEGLVSGIGGGVTGTDDL
ncbi:hypothetical protein DAETH_32320 [Deinococcus aetherius]|uniref:Uncharacterized protein n=1 Tax=Deinococcus aetherius TaxID=200252 RepID=A0ABN6RKH0_9DEIO|nr:hypothetical protein [Deinococcus aetherius]BDP43263.1 hypothetical protein DAETH_32320 [Deinococcus aetherius]